MRYRGGGIGHGYMREVEDQFEDARREQVNLEGASQTTRSSQDADDDTGETPAGATSTGDTSLTNSDRNDYFEEDDLEGDLEDEPLETHGEDDNFSGGESEDDNDLDGDEVGQDTYGMGKY